MFGFFTKQRINSELMILNGMFFNGNLIWTFQNVIFKILNTKIKLSGKDERLILRVVIISFFNGIHYVTLVFRKYLINWLWLNLQWRGLKLALVILVDFPNTNMRWNISLEINRFKFVCDLKPLLNVG